MWQSVARRKSAEGLFAILGWALIGLGSAVGLLLIAGTVIAVFGIRVNADPYPGYYANLLAKTRPA
jgi:hypothetical protein